jgi:hypothetical protein
MRALACVLAAGTLAALGGCPLGGGQINPFVTYTEIFGAGGGTDSPVPPGSGGGSATGRFRTNMVITLQNVDPEAEVNVALAAWVNPSSIRNADQSDALISAGYVQIGREIRIGSAYTLAPGTFVLNGPGQGGALPLIVPPGDGTAPGSATVTLVTPDVLLLFRAPPVSCDTPGFEFTIDGFPLRDIPAAGEEGGEFPSSWEGADGLLGIKTLAMYDVYQCDPFRPGLFFKVGGGAKARNEYFEGESVTVTFSRLTQNGVAARVVIGS